MSKDEYITMIACWKKQQRLIDLKNNDDLNTIEKSIIDVYHLQQSNVFYEHQVQFYDQNFQTFIDLCSETIHRFQQLVKYLQSKDAPSKTENIWRLKIIPKAIEKINYISQDSTAVDTYHYPREKIEDTTCSSDSTTNIEDLHEATTSYIINDDQQGTNRFGDESISGSDHSLFKTEADNLLNFHFEIDIADHQRNQYESDVNRKANSKSSSLGGVRLRAPNLDDSTSQYPTVNFQIPQTKQNSSWRLFIYILTECDTNGNYYVHASKGIFDNNTLPEDKFGPIANSNLVNPFFIDLSSSDIQQGKYEIRLRVCNIRNLSSHKHEHLRKFPELKYFMMYNDTKLISNYTSTNLNFSSEKYHLGCALACNNVVQDRCISKLTTDSRPNVSSNNKRKRTNDEIKITKKKKHTS